MPNNISKLDYFAAMAMQGLLVKYPFNEIVMAGCQERVTDLAYTMAELMLEQSNSRGIDEV